jgi:hypothetical protein
MLDFSNFTRVAPNIIQCNDCGAYAAKIQDIEHFENCVPGEAKEWEDYYREQYNYLKKDEDFFMFFGDEL